MSAAVLRLVIMAERRGPTDGGRFKRVRKSDEVKKHGGKQGRPTLLTPEIQKRVVELIRRGNYIDVAFRTAGIASVTYYEWLTKGGRGVEPYATFTKAVEKAVGESEAAYVSLIAKAATTQWQAAAWHLERKHPKKWGRKDHLEVAGDQEKPLNVNIIEWGPNGEKLEF